MNESPYKVSGLERRVLKKELSVLKTYVKNFWHYQDIDNVYGGGLTEEECKNTLDKCKKKIEDLEKELSEPSLSIKRDNKLNNLNIDDR